MELEPVLIKQATAMEMADIKSITTLKKRIANGEFPQPIFKNGRRWYRFDAVKAHLNQDADRLESGR